MQINGIERYTKVARALHWIIAVLVIVNLILGIGHDAMESIFPAAMPVHKSIGLTVLALTLVRIVWRVTHPAPPLPADMPALEKIGANLVHYIFYLFLILVPLSGWIMSSAGRYPLNWFGLFDVPKFAVEKGSPMAGISHESHEIMGFAFAGLALLHIAAALRHRFILKDGILQRMLG